MAVPGDVPKISRKAAHLPGKCRFRPDDAQITDEPLFQQLKAGFSSSVDYSYEIEEPNVIRTEDTDDFEWPKNGEEAAKLWVVVIDYQF